MNKITNAPRLLSRLTVIKKDGTRIVVGGEKPKTRQPSVIGRPYWDVTDEKDTTDAISPCPK